MKKTALTNPPSVAAVVATEPRGPGSADKLFDVLWNRIWNTVDRSLWREAMEAINREAYRPGIDTPQLKQWIESEKQFNDVVASLRYEKNQDALYRHLMDSEELFLATGFIIGLRVAGHRGKGERDPWEPYYLRPDHNGPTADPIDLPDSLKEDDQKIVDSVEEILREAFHYRSFIKAVIEPAQMTFDRSRRKASGER